MKTFIKTGKNLIGLKKILQDLQDWQYCIKEFKKTRNISQNSRYWAILWYIEAETGNSSELLHELMKKKFLSKRKLVKLWKKKVRSNEVKSTTKLNTKEFALYCNKVEEFFRDFGIFIPEYDSLEFRNLIETYEK